jgi:hypothetical protein
MGFDHWHYLILESLGLTQIHHWRPLQHSNHLLRAMETVSEM